MTTATAGAVPVPTHAGITDEDRAVAKRHAVRYLVASTGIFLAAGLLGELLRSSQAGLGRIDDNYWYAVMTAHGLGAFLGWAGFAVMGLSWWVLAQVGVPIRRLAGAMAHTTFWTMIVGVVGVIVSTLGMSFAGSWVFLYPLPFESAGEWGDAATAVFLTSVLIVGVSIITWCVGILAAVMGPHLGGESRSPLKRFGVAMGLGLLWPRTFASSRPVPYPVIPLTVIAIDMIIATVPLAALLVEMIFQTFTDVSVDPLFAKNVLWWFGHPVVYLLLFPAVAVYYYLVPKFAGRPLVAGNVVSVAWIIAALANVLVWAHHVYLDHPEGGIQGSINLAMQFTTFALALPSALSLYALGFTIFRAPSWKWTAATTALFLGLVNWLVSGLSGIVNATIRFNEEVHNTLWVVGHFHHMALLNIGILIFAGIYAFLPGLFGRELWSDALGKWHIWMTFLFGLLNSIFWMAQGIDGAPRRFAVQLTQWEGLARAGVYVSFALGAAQLLFVWNMVQTLRGAPKPRPERERQVGFGLATGAAVALIVAGLFAEMIRGGDQPIGPPAASASPAGGEGAQVFTANGCGGCHTLSVAGATGAVGPNLDTTTLDEAGIV
ncbi:MAG: cbb3-type cytochrome c oxidase subunit I, partial [Actinomycetota bacterium]